VGVALARLVPAKAGAIMARAQDYAMSREYCGAHYPAIPRPARRSARWPPSCCSTIRAWRGKVAAAKAELARI
jgi:acid phosphatase (class A)